MRQYVEVRPMGEHEFAAVVGEGDIATRHRVVVPEELSDEVRVRAARPELSERQIASESLAFLLEHKPGTALPHDIDLGGVNRDDERFLPEVSTRLMR
ncbi:hypothetical protein NLX83_03790 [Allokutzneria sp. A3M-2-11 16]|uniref:hypothetical protein n=1 Tax=Allokutzneria sp. A3M-2-11 16 TaxID=2962043 RepID=UPI0020B6E347|nr:hypothetical protein [Allokutzneria sp. A3M-2-11 16]MCP3798374.1 hypothetical protein [Allokutzneria sp. A3M-2-11 16]